MPLARGLEPLVVHRAVLRGVLLRAVLVEVARPLAQVAAHRVPLALPLALGDHPLRLLPVRVLPADVGPCGRHGLRRGCLLGGHLGGVGGEPAAVPAHRAVAQVADAIHQLEQVAVVRDHQQRARPAADDVVEPVAGRGVEVVGGLVEQQDVGSSQHLPGQPELHHLAARQLAEPAAEHAGGQAEPGERGGDPLLDVPVVADGLVVGRRDRPGLDRPQRAQGRGDAEELGHRAGAVEHQVLRQVADRPGDAHVPCGRGELAGDDAQQRRLAAPVDADQAGAAGWDEEVETVEDDGPVGPGESAGRGRRGWRTWTCGSSRSRVEVGVDGPQSFNAGPVVGDGSRATVRRPPRRRHPVIERAGGLDTGSLALARLDHRRRPPEGLDTGSLALARLDHRRRPPEGLDASGVSRPPGRVV